MLEQGAIVVPGRDDGNCHLPGFSVWNWGMRKLVTFAAAVAFLAVPAAGGELTEQELAHPVTADRIADLQARAARGGWAAVSRDVRGVALQLYEKQGAQAQQWYYLYRWTQLFGQTEAAAVVSWSQAVKQAKAGHGNMQQESHPGQHQLGEFWPPDLQAFAMRSPEFSEQFFGLLSPLDYPPMVMSLLTQLWIRQPVDFREYAGLALAIAVVYDVPPPPQWPHAQVSAEALPRKLLPPADVFAFFVKADRAGATLHRLRQLPASELRFLVDSGAAFDEMIWAQHHVTVPLPELAKAYSLVRYRKDRLQSGVMLWTLPTYRLPDIVKEGGICVDQAYFAAMVGKARGVPTLLFRGAGLDGRHAWFGFLGEGRRWEFDAGRYAEQRYVTGEAIDPQTWLPISDHELAFLSEGFHRLPLFKSSRMHSQFAAIYGDLGNYPAAAKAARTAVNIEGRNLGAWDLLIATQAQMGAGAKAVEGLFQEAARAFQKYPDIEAEFKQLLSRSLRTRGETSAADYLERGLAHKYAVGREDLSAQQAQEIIMRSMARDDIRTATRTFYSVMESLGPGAGVAFFDQVVQPFVDYLLRNGETREAIQAVEKARKILRVEKGGAVEAGLNALADRAGRAAR